MANTFDTGKSPKRNLDDMLPKRIVSAINRILFTDRKVASEEVDGIVVNVIVINERAEKRSLKQKAALIGRISIGILAGVTIGIEVAIKYPELVPLAKSLIGAIFQSF